MPAAGNGQELVGKWCKVTNFQRQRRQHLTLGVLRANANGTYTYAYEGSMSVQAGSTASQSGDAGRWSYNGSQLVAQSRSGRTANYNLVKRNHPKNKGDPMICLNDACYVRSSTSRLGDSDYRIERAWLSVVTLQ